MPKMVLLTAGLVLHTWPSLQIYLSDVAVMQPGLCFLERVINVWNSLPYAVANFSSVKAFKRSLRAIDISGFCTGSF